MDLYTTICKSTLDHLVYSRHDLLGSLYRALSEASCTLGLVPRQELFGLGQIPQR